MPFPYVESATIQNNVIELTLEFDHPDSGSYVEVSGSATQPNGAYANFYAIREVTPGLSDPSGPNPTVTVRANPVSQYQFDPTQVITFVIAAAPKWLTVLGPGVGNPKTAEETWDKVLRWSQVTSGSSDGSQGNTPQPPDNG
jgi:hypothetical protein